MFKYLLALFVCVATSHAHAQATGDSGGGTAIRPVDLYIYSEAKGINERIETRMSAVAIKHLTLTDSANKAICSGELNAATKNWVFSNLQCPSLGIDIPKVTLTENFRWGVLRHGLAKVELANGLIVGVFLHLGNETEYESLTRIPTEKIQSLYGVFPAWKAP